MESTVYYTDRAFEENVFDKCEIERNWRILNEPEMRGKIDEAERSLVQRLTGKREISPGDRQDLDKVEEKLISITGLAEYPFFSPIWRFYV